MKKINTFGQQLINANDEMLTVEEVAQLFKGMFYKLTC